MLPRTSRLAGHFYESREAGIGDYFVESILSDLGSLVLYAGIQYPCPRTIRWSRTAASLFRSLPRCNSDALFALHLHSPRRSLTTHTMKKFASLSGSLALLIIVGLLLWPRLHSSSHSPTGYSTTMDVSGTVGASFRGEISRTASAWRFLASCHGA